MKEQLKQQIEALASILNYTTRKSVIDKVEISEAEQRLDKVLTSLDQSKKFFQRLL